MYRLKKFISARDRFTLLINNLPTRVVPLKIKVVAVDYDYDDPKHIEGGYALCPMCNKWGYNVPSDYTSHAMIWCNCSYLVLDTDNMVEINIDTVYDELKSANIEDFNHNKNTLTAFEIPLAYILRGADFQIDNLEFIDGKYSEQKVREFMPFADRNEYCVEFYKENLEKYGLRKAPPIKYKSGRRKDTDVYERFYEYEPGYTVFNPLDYNSIHNGHESYANIEGQDLKVYLPINSYDVDFPFFPLTEGIYWMHDVFVRMECTKVLPDGRLDKTKFAVCQWTD